MSRKYSDNLVRKKLMKSERGVTLIEAMVAAVIVGIGFVAVYSLSTASTRVLMNSIDREKGNMMANMIMEDLITDLANIDSYNTKTTCSYGAGICTTDAISRSCMDLTEAPSATTESYQKKQVKWQTHASTIFNPIADMHSNDCRILTVDETSAGSKKYLITIYLSTNDGRAKNEYKRIINGL
mgnify:CR=1 FL=1